ncbi:MAG: DNA-processing protein DprA [Agathobacter sp.]|nr:DNA-processing protein DprA [Agathobacter sp.]
MKYAYWLHNISGIGNAKIRMLYEVASSAEEIYHLPLQQLRKVPGLKEDDIKALQKSQKKWDLDKEWISLMEKGIGFVCLEQDEFPEKVRNIPNSPYALYYVGKLPNENRKCVAIVGARTRTAYGSQVAQELGKALAKQGVSVISGLARGIDRDAHQGALDANGETFAVLGNGVDICYPKENKFIYNQMIETGGIISEYPPGTQPVAKQFPARNRIIAGFCDCLVVIEAREKSGSLITADFAMEQGRDVYALPGRITDPLSQGCNHLIKQGAGAFISIEDFMSDLDVLSQIYYTQFDFKKNLLEKDESLVYSLTDFRPIGVATLVDKTGISISRLLEILNKLESLGLIKETFTNYYIRTLLN